MSTQISASELVNVLDVTANEVQSTTQTQGGIDWVLMLAIVLAIALVI